MDLLEATRELVKQYPGSYGAMAQRLGKSPDTLRREVNSSPGFKMGLEDAHDMTHFALEARQPNALVVLSAFAANCGCMVIPLPASTQQGGECLKRLAVLANDFSQLVAEVAADLSDDSVTDNELKRIEGKGGDVIVALQSLLTAARSSNEAAKPLHIRRAA